MGLTLTLVSQLNIISMLEGAFASEAGEPWTRYDGFDGQWYYQIGSIITTTLLINCFIANFIEIMLFLYKQCSRLRDRNYKESLKENPDDDFCDEVNTNKFVQQELEDLYMGDAFNG